jgi:predicted acetyltransferase
MTEKVFTSVRKNMWDLDIGQLGVIETDAKELLAKYIGSDKFTRRKSYEEWYISIDNLRVDFLKLSDLSVLSKHFKVMVNEDTVFLSL